MSMRTAAILAYRVVALFAFAWALASLWVRGFAPSPLLVAGGVALWRWAPRLTARVIPGRAGTAPSSDAAHAEPFYTILAVAVSIVGLFALGSAALGLESLIALMVYGFKDEMFWSRFVIASEAAFIVRCAIGLVLLFRPGRIAKVMMRRWGEGEPVAAKEGSL